MQVRGLINRMNRLCVCVLRSNVHSFRVTAVIDRSCDRFLDVTHGNSNEYPF